jgi:hypothetical protein
MSSNCLESRSRLRRSNSRRQKQPLTPKDIAVEGERMCALFGANFRKARLRARMTPADLELLTGIRGYYVSQMELGLQDPTLDTMATLAEAVATEVHSLLRPPPRRR